MEARGCTRIRIEEGGVKNWEGIKTEWGGVKSWKAE